MRKSAIPLSILLFVTLITVSGPFAADVLYARYPALSPDGGTIAFTYQGDLWTVPSEGGRATRLTVHEAEDVRPQYSPDGKWLLFSSRRHNNYDVFIMPAEGGEVRQLTYHTADDFGSGWFPQGDSVLFTT
ncbi:MAG: peptidase S41, partial [candidate division Zixibacteria bacterium]|nr:peptidase S41 [candidate division Zixibacteria bacterium]